MALSRTTRVAMIDEVLSKFDGRQDGEAWDLVRVNNVLEGYGLNPAWVDGSGDHLDLARISLRDAPDDVLAELHGYVVGSASPTTPDSGPDEAADLWTPDHIRLFLSHSAVHKAFVADVADHLSLSNVHGFVAHDSIEPSREWQVEIERALRTADLFVGLVHPEFLESAWTNQEVGWARGRDMPLFMIRLGADPAGFPGKTQWPSMLGSSATVVAGRILEWINTLPQYSGAIAGRLLAALENARSYFEAQDAGNALNSFDALNDEQWRELDRIFLANDQVGGSVLAHKALKPLYNRHGRSFPKRT